MAESEFEQDELADLLDEIDAVDAQEETDRKLNSRKPKSKGPKNDPVLEAAQRPQKIVISNVLGVDTTNSGDDDPAANLTRKLMQQAEEVQSKIWAKIEEDREQLRSYIEIFTSRISDSSSTKAFYVEAITNLLNTKAATSMNASKILDSLAKILSALRNMKSDAMDNLALQRILQDIDADGFDPDAP